MAPNNEPSKNTKTYRDHANEYYNQKYETWMPWIEDQYLKWFTKDNKASYATKRESSPLSLIPIYISRRPPPYTNTPLSISIYVFLTHTHQKTSTRPK